MTPSLLLLLCCTFVVSRRIDPKKCIIDGPLLKSPNVILPIYHFEIYAVDDAGVNYTTSPNLQTPFAAKLIGQTEPREQGGRYEPYKLDLEVKDRGDGSFFLSWKHAYWSFHQLSLEITHAGVHVGGSPYTWNSLVAEECVCPWPDPLLWRQITRCNIPSPQLEIDLNRWEDHSISSSHFHNGIKELSKGNNNCFMHYAIINNEVYAKPYGPYTGFRMFSDAILLAITRRVRIPDVEFLINLGDWPIAIRELKNVPVFSWCGSKNAGDIILPTYMFVRWLTESVLEDVHLIDSQTYQHGGWNQKIDKLFWRGRDARRERLELVRLAKNHPEQIDAGLTNYFFFRNGEEQELGKVDRVNYIDFFKYKYQLNIDGSVAAYRFASLLASDSVVFKTDSEWYEHFYIDLQPYVHYIPVKSDLSDLLTQIEWAKNHDEEVREMSRNARVYVRQHLQPNHILCYYQEALTRFATKLSYKVQISEDMVIVQQPGERKRVINQCNCVYPETIPSQAATDESSENQILHNEL